MFFLILGYYDNLVTKYYIFIFFSYYDDFVTIDWVRDSNRDRVRHKQLEVDRKLSWKGCGIKLWDALSGWFIVFLVGVSSGLFAGKRMQYKCLFKNRNLVRDMDDDVTTCDCRIFIRHFHFPHVYCHVT